jgi:hypothetical protein
MPDYTFDVSALKERGESANIAALHWLLRKTPLGPAVNGVSYNGFEIIVHAARDLSEAELGVVRNIIEREAFSLVSLRPGELVVDFEELLALLKERFGIEIRPLGDGSRFAISGLPPRKGV